MGLVSISSWLAGGVLLLIAAWSLRRTSPLPNARVVLRLSLEPRRTIYVVSLAGRHLVLGGSEGGVSLLAELDAQAVAQLQPSSPQLSSLLTAWTRS